VGGSLRLAVLLAGLSACRSTQSQVEPGAALLHVKCAPGEATPDSLLVWVYDDTGVLWNGERVPKDGALSTMSKGDLGTILVQPGHLLGALRIHIVGMQEAKSILDGVLSIPSLGTGLRTFDLVLSSDALADTDGDGVPDSIDYCPTANPLQEDCPESPGRDGGSDGSAALSDSVPRDETRPLADVSSPADGLADKTVGDASDDVKKDSLAEGSGDAQRDGAGDIPGPEIVNRDGSTDGVDRSDVAPDVAPTSDSALRCDDAGACGKSQGIACAGSGECASGQCVDGVCCTNSCVGACRSCNQPSAVGMCQGYAAGTDPERECATGAACNGAGACGAPPTNLANGQLCTLGSQCSSHVCKDGVCCNSACTDACQTCGSGTCTAVKRSDDVPECTGTKTCNGKGVCVSR
jgi:hypothetical protein